ncbi:hypothetical protein B9Z65_9248 [Elsinoe australis]|uniref:Uncharacterized protein n=1 Tax=Elsinoe australis TaxID=40998 RepID=A0A2P7Z0W3_9PEZI|nr:hypothetical protein B9Z65_9248 [Elsinoe australis]
MLSTSVRPPGNRTQNSITPTSNEDSGHPSPAPGSDQATTSAPTPTGVSYTSNVQRPNLVHLRILSQYLAEPDRALGMGFADSKTTADLILKHSLEHEFLMCLLLAFAALRQATSQPDHQSRELYHESMELLNIGIKGLGEATSTLNSESLAPTFLASSLIGSHMLCETFAFNHAESTDAFFDRLLHTIRVIRGTRAVLSEGNWANITKSEIAPLFGLHVINRENGEDDKTPYFRRLYTLIESCNLDLDDKVICGEVTDQLLKTYGSDSTDPQIRKISTSVRARAWPVVTDKRFMHMLENRSPVALILTAHWAVLLHDLEGDWPIGNAGKRVVDATEAILGTAWGDWLAWPREVVNRPIQPT